MNLHYRRLYFLHYRRLFLWELTLCKTILIRAYIIQDYSYMGVDYTRLFLYWHTLYNVILMCVYIIQGYTYKGLHYMKAIFIRGYSYSRVRIKDSNLRTCLSLLVFWFCHVLRYGKIKENSFAETVHYSHRY